MLIDQLINWRMTDCWLIDTLNDDKLLTVWLLLITIKVFEVADLEFGIHFFIPDIPELFPNKKL